jgi:hypothetical protein
LPAIAIDVNDVEAGHLARRGYIDLVTAMAQRRDALLFEKAQRLQQVANVVVCVRENADAQVISPS